MVNIARLHNSQGKISVTETILQNMALGSLFVQLAWPYLSLVHRMTKLIKPSGKDYVDLTVSFEGDEKDDLPGPPVRYYFGLWASISKCYLSVGNKLLADGTSRLATTYHYLI